MNRRGVLIGGVAVAVTATARAASRVAAPLPTTQPVVAQNVDPYLNDGWTVSTEDSYPWRIWLAPDTTLPDASVWEHVDTGEIQVYVPLHFAEQLVGGMEPPGYKYPARTLAEGKARVEAWAAQAPDLILCVGGDCHADGRGWTLWAEGKFWDPLAYAFNPRQGWYDRLVPANGKRPRWGHGHGNTRMGLRPLRLPDGRVVTERVWGYFEVRDRRSGRITWRGA